MLYPPAASTKSSRPPKPKPINPIISAITTWHSTLPSDLVTTLTTTLEDLLSTAPKRWVVYPPMVLLPSGSFASHWAPILNPSFPSHHLHALWTHMLTSITTVEGKGALTHLAINSGIPLHTNVEENIMRSPSGLILLHGDFGPSSTTSPPTALDFAAAFWVTTKQNGITQTWAPRWTMFSRGNVKEKARVLGFEAEKGDIAVDLYAGIGYFVFSYAKLGMRVVGWEINGWSVEGLRRGAGANGNGWGVRVVREGEGWVDGGERVVVFEESNEKSKKRLEGLGERESGKVRHVNSGLLPSSEGSWEMALGILRGEGWIHVHENVGVNEVESKKVEIESKFKSWLSEAKDTRQVEIEHVEFVKTFAPGVWHCVFDVYIKNNTYA